MRHLAAYLWLGLAPLAAAQSPETHIPRTLVDRIVAVVDEDPILLSDLRQVIALELAEERPQESEPERQRRVLDQLIEQRLRLHEVDRYDFSPPPGGEVDFQVAQIRERFASAEDFDRHLAEIGLDTDGLRYLLARQLRVLAYIEERLGPRIFIGLDDVRAYYDETLAPKAEREGVALPPFEAVREEVRAILREIRLNEEIERWTAELRERADIRDYLERPARELPPVVLRLENDG